MEMNPGCRVQDHLNTREPTAPYIRGRELNLRKARQWESKPQPSEQLQPMTIALLPKRPQQINIIIIIIILQYIIIILNIIIIILHYIIIQYYYTLILLIPHFK